ncbi:tRNA (5-methylaminomethyl-2-thiouridine)(34)-methyltransferase MnmD [Nonlabens xiamenensis]|uniref:tRNA (5-methylaminomethyl-2-thiouridine)(34)-methyltransferase MnmD n=1 Tax=Nonlabens xiamenensis TaxID=2341043 RepID=UPI000F61537E|nr:tRNA (5-methylaminomethyl-2-thiouridine)(34)-methyltransferase MnmD [Nonlabens xiamenensis]
MKREIITTADGSKTIHMPQLNEQYHSKHGALQEALHVFIQEGLAYFINRLAAESASDKSELHILEYGLGTGLNAMLTAQYDTPQTIHYTGIEAFPISEEEMKAMTYGELLGDQILYENVHQASWGEKVAITEKFVLTKIQATFQDIDFQDTFDIIYFDAFGPRTQPELWTLPIFEVAYRALKPGGILTTYCAAGQVRRNLQEIGFAVERLPGPPGKREMLRGTKKY